MKLLLDTNVLIWSTLQPLRLRVGVQELLLNPENTLLFSVVSLWEMSIRFAQNRPDFRIDPRVLRKALIDRGDQELQISGPHATGVLSLPPIHRDPFDRLLLAQAEAEQAVFLTSDALLTTYPVTTLRV